MDVDSLNVAIVHDYLVQWRGGEKVFRDICGAFPRAEVYVLLGQAELSEELARWIRRPVRTTFLSSLPCAPRWFRKYFILFPAATASLRLSGYDVVITSSTSFTHWLPRSTDGAVHICYCNSPLRYAWSAYRETIQAVPWALRLPFAVIAKIFRTLDRRAASRVDIFIANSSVVKDRILRFYGRNAEVICPSVDVNRFSLTPSMPYYLCVSALVPYKRVDVAVNAFNLLGLPLKIVGVGPENGHLRQLAGPTIEFLGCLPDDELRVMYEQCLAFVFPTSEDYGITPLEAQAAGKPVFAFGEGGALETILPGITGQFFYPQTAQALADCVRVTNVNSFDPAAIRAHAAQFGPEAFRRAIRRSVAGAFATKNARGASPSRS